MTNEMTDRNAILEEAALVAEQLQETFGSNKFAVGQPESSFAERFACGMVAEEIRKLKTE